MCCAFTDPGRQQRTSSCLCNSSIIPQESHYAITELETVAVVWAILHFHAYLCGHDVLVYTDHFAVKVMLQTLSANSKHARW